MIQIINKAFRKFGYNISPISKQASDKVGIDPINDMKLFVPEKKAQIFDIGANKGQSIIKFTNAYPECNLHSFEPNPEAFLSLKNTFGEWNNVKLNNYALGEAKDQKDLIMNEFSNMSSFLNPGQDCWGKIIGETKVDVETVDNYCKNNSINYIHILKSDTQGYEYQVLKGSEEMLSKKLIKLVYLEIIFSNMYKESSKISDIFNFLAKYNYQLVSFYKTSYQNLKASWTDALFVSCN